VPLIKASIRSPDLSYVFVPNTVNRTIVANGDTGRRREAE